jgi:hypothetical protein
LIALQNLAIAVGSLNPDPEKTIGEHRKEQKQTTLLSFYAAITSTIAILFTALEIIFR